MMGMERIKAKILEDSENKAGQILSRPGNKPKK